MSILRIAAVALSLAGAATVSVPSASASDADDMLGVTIDHARVLKLQNQAETIIIGNPAIVDVTVHDSRTLILTGRSYGITNLIVLGANGQAIIDEEISVRNLEKNTVRIFRQAERQTFACAPTCEPTVTIGDTNEAMANAAAQFQTKQAMTAGAM